MPLAESQRRVKGFVVLTLAFHQEDKRWLGRCLELGTSTYGRTLKQVHAELVELVELHLNALEDAGERERFFEEHGITFYTADQAPGHVRPSIPVDTEYYVHPHRFPMDLAA